MKITMPVSSNLKPGCNHGRTACFAILCLGLGIFSLLGFFVTWVGCIFGLSSLIFGALSLWELSRFSYGDSVPLRRLTLVGMALALIAIMVVLIFTLNGSAFLPEVDY